MLAGVGMAELSDEVKSLLLGSLLCSAYVAISPLGPTVCLLASKGRTPTINAWEETLSYNFTHATISSLTL